MLTPSKARLVLIRRNTERKYNWLFLPGGPGLGSESLQDLTDILHLPGSMWYVDFPDDGSNIAEHGDRHFADWRKALFEATSQFDNVILVAHSSGGMFALSAPEIEKNLIGLVLMASSPDAGWQQSFQEYVKQHPLPDADKLQQVYDANPTDDVLKRLTIVCAPYFSTSHGMDNIRSRLEQLPFNHVSHVWARDHFDDTYQSKWVPQTIPTLIFTGDQDYLTPLKLFRQAPAFQRNNIYIREIKDAAHFPWIENPESVRQVFAEFCQHLK